MSTPGKLNDFKASGRYSAVINDTNILGEWP